jgi:hypothetical protein
MEVGMAQTSIDQLLDQVTWQTVENAPSEDDLPYATHEGWLEIQGARLHVFQLNDGSRVIEQESFERFLTCNILVP